MMAILRLRDDAYGVTIHAEANERFQPRSVSIGAIYFTLDRLEDKGLISSRLSDPGPERGGRAKRYYRLEALGERAPVDVRDVLEIAHGHWGKEAGSWNPRRPRWNPVRPK